MKNLDFSKRIKSLLQTLDFNQSDLASKIGLSQGVISEFSSGAREPSKEFIFGLSKIGISVDWFLTGVGEMFLNSLPAVQSEKAVVKPEAGHKIPLLRQKVSCGSGMDWQDESNIVEYIDVFDLMPRIKTKRLFALCVEGTSMLGAGIRNGDYVLFDAGTDQWVRDGVYVFALDGEVYCKRLEFDGIQKNGIKIKIYSVRVADLDKAELLAIIDMSNIEDAERLTIFGRVLYWIHPNKEGD